MFSRSDFHFKYRFCSRCADENYVRMIYNVLLDEVATGK